MTKEGQKRKGKRKGSMSSLGIVKVSLGISIIYIISYISIYIKFYAK